MVNPAKSDGWIGKLTSHSVLMIFALVWLCAEFVLLGKFSFVYTGDNTTALIPGMLTLKFADTLNPLWNNFSSAGWDRIATNPQGLVNRYLFLMLPGWLAYQTNILAQIFVAFCGTYWLGRRVLQLNQMASLFSAFVFASGVSGQLDLASVFLLPAILVTLTRVLNDKRRIATWLWLITATFVVAHTAWISEMLPFTSAAVVTWFLFIDVRRRIADWLIILLCTVTIILLRMPDVLALMQYAALSHRPLLITTPEISQWPWALSSIDNLMCLVLLAYTFAVRKGGDHHMCGIVIAISTWLVLPYGITFFHEPLTSAFPLLEGYTYFSRTSSVPRIAVAFAGGYGIQALVAGGEGGRFADWSRKALLAAASVTILIVALDQKKMAVKNWFSQGNMVLNYESPPLQNLAKKIQANPWPVRVEPFQMYPAYLHTYGMETAGGLHALFSRRYYEFWSTILEPWLKQKPAEASNLNPKFFAKTGDWPLFRGAILMLTADDHKAERRIGEIFRLNLLSLANVAYLVSRDRLVDASLEPYLESSVTWSSLTSWQKVKQNLLGNFSGRKNLFIYHNRNVLPRFFSATSVRLFVDGRATLKALADASMEELRTTLFIEKRYWPAEQNSAQNFVPATVQLDSYKSDEIQLTIDGNGPALLFVGNSYSPFWSVQVDGNSVQIFPANHAFWGIILPDGAKSVKFRYQPPYARAFLWKMQSPSAR